MNSMELYRYINKDRHMSSIFGGIYHSDQLPNYAKDRSLMFVYNSLPSYSLPNDIGHWTLF